MSYYSDKRNIKETIENKTVAVATYERGAEIIVKCLNYYFDGNTHSNNDAVKMMHQNTANGLISIADFVEKHDYSAKDIIEYMREIAEEMEAQAVVVSMRDELKFDKPNE